MRPASGERKAEERGWEGRGREKNWGWRKGSALETERGRQMQSIGIRIKVSKNTELWGMTGTGNVWEKM